MPWYASSYLVGLTALIIFSAFDDLCTGDPFLVIVVDLLEGCAYWTFVMFWYRIDMPAGLIVIIPALLLGAAIWTVRRARQTLRRLIADETELTPEETQLALRVTILVGVLVVAPSYIAGVGVMYRLVMASVR